MMSDRPASKNRNGGSMLKPTKKTHTLLIGAIIVAMIMYFNHTLGAIGGENGKKKESQEVAKLEEVLTKIEGIGEVVIYFHYENGETKDTLSNYFSVSSSTKTNENPLKGLLVVAEGVDNPTKKYELSNILSAVLQLPEHRIIIVEMKKRGNQHESE